MQGQLIIRRAHLPAIVGISLATIDRLRARGAFPPPVRLGDQAVGWNREQVLEWVATRPTVNR